MKKTEEQAGLAGWLLGRLANLTGGFGRKREEKHMEVVEVLALGGKRELMLVVCDGQRYLVGAGADGVQTIVAAIRPVETTQAKQGLNGGHMQVVARRGLDRFAGGM